MNFNSHQKETKRFDLCSLGTRSTGIFMKKEQRLTSGESSIPISPVKNNFKETQSNVGKQTVYSAFMNNYIERLKRERKRQEKKQHQKINASRKTHFQRTKSLVEKNQKRSLFSEIQPIKEDSQRKSQKIAKVIIGVDEALQRKLTEAEQRRRIQFQQKVRVIEGIQGLKQSKEKRQQKIRVDLIEPFPKVMHKQKKEKSINLPIIKVQKSISFDTGLKQQKQFQPFQIKDLEPWKGEYFPHSFSIEEYHHTRRQY